MSKNMTFRDKLLSVALILFMIPAYVLFIANNKTWIGTGILIGWIIFVLSLSHNKQVEK